MAKTPNFRRQPVPPPPPAAGDAPGAPQGASQIPAQQNPGDEPDSKLPLPTGQATMTDYTKRQLKKLGWQEGDPVPGDMGLRIQRVARKIQDEAAEASHGFEPGSRAKVGRTVDLDDLPAEEKERLARHLAAFKEEMRQEAQQAAAQAELESQVTQTADPSVQEAQRIALQAQQRQEAQRAAQQAGPEVVLDDSPQQQASQQYAQQVAEKMPAHLQPREGAQVVSADGIANFVTQNPQEAMQKQQEAVAADERVRQEQAAPEEEPEGAGGTAALERCPRCLWKLDMPFEAEPTEADKQLFIAGVIGNTRFTKTYNLMGGNLQVTYRSLTSNEVDLVFHQIGIEARNGMILTEPEYMMKLQDYRLVLSVERIADGAGHTIAECPPVFDIPYDEPEAGRPEETRLRPMREWFMEEVCPSESLRRLVAQNHRVFQRVVEALEAMTSEPDFWSGIGQQP